MAHLLVSVRRSHRTIQWARVYVSTCFFVDTYTLHNSYDGWCQFSYFVRICHLEGVLFLSRGEHQELGGQAALRGIVLQDLGRNEVDDVLAEQFVSAEHASGFQL